METVMGLLDRAKKACKAETDMELATCLHVTRQALSRWRVGDGYPDEVNCERIAHLTGEPLARVLGIVGEARAKTAAAKKVWRRLQQSVGAVIVLSAGVALTPSPAVASQSDSWAFSPGLYIMSSRRRIGRRGWRGRIRRTSHSRRFTRPYRYAARN